MVVGHLDAEDPILAQARGEALDEALAVDGLLGRAGEPRAAARCEGKERVGMEGKSEGRRGEREPSQLFAGDGEYEFGVAFGRRVEHVSCGSDPVGTFATCGDDGNACAVSGCPGTALGWQRSARSERWTQQS